MWHSIKKMIYHSYVLYFDVLKKSHKTQLPITDSKHNTKQSISFLFTKQKIPHKSWIIWCNIMLDSKTDVNATCIILFTDSMFIKRQLQTWEFRIILLACCRYGFTIKNTAVTLLYFCVENSMSHFVIFILSITRHHLSS